MATKIGSNQAGKRRRLIFYSLMIAWPVLQFCVFYIGVNFNSILLAFQKVDVKDQSKYYWISNLDNFTKWFTDPNEYKILSDAFVISLKAYAISLIVGVPLGLFFSYYIFKKLPMSGFFRVVLFLPSIISSIVLVTIYQYFVQQALPAMFNIPRLLDLNSSHRFETMMVYNVFVSFGTTVLMYSNKMAGIPPEIIESAQLDGAGALKEFFHIVLPMAFSTISVFLVTGVAGIFNNQINNFAFFTSNTIYPDTATIGYVLYIRTKLAGHGKAELPSIAALSLMLTFIAVPLTYLVRYLLNRFGPSED